MIKFGSIRLLQLHQTLSLCPRFIHVAVTPSSSVFVNHASRRNACGIHNRRLSSKTPVSKSSLVAAEETPSSTSVLEKYPKQLPLEPIHIESLPSESKAVAVIKRMRKRKEIMRMPESELEGYTVGMNRLPFLDRSGVHQSVYRQVAGDKSNSADVLFFVHQDIDLSSASIKRWWQKVELASEIKMQMYNPTRNAVLGNDLAAAHFLVFRHGKIKFMGESEWVTKYRKDAEEGKTDDDLPVMRFDLCALPVKFDPKFRVEAIDAGGVPLHYEGLLNFEKLLYVKWVSFRDNCNMNDWCIDRAVRIFSRKLEYLDLSGCKNVSLRGISALGRCKKLKTLVLENMSHIKYLAVACSQLEEMLPDLDIIGVDYERHLLHLRDENEKFEQDAREELAKLEANTVTIEPKYGEGPDPPPSSFSPHDSDLNSNQSKPGTKNI